jgi:hypothetical protein
MNMYNYFLKAAVSLRTLSSLVINLFTQVAIVLELALVSLHCSLGEGDGYSITNPICIKVPESDLLLVLFDSGDPCPDCFDPTLTTDEDDGPKLEASVFTPGGKLAVQVWFGSYKFTDKSKETRLFVRLLKLWRLQSLVSGFVRSPVTPRKLPRRSLVRYLTCQYHNS